MKKSIILILILITYNVYSANIYCNVGETVTIGGVVYGEGDNLNGDGSIEKPYATIVKSFDDCSVSVYDTIYLISGSKNFTDSNITTELVARTSLIGISSDTGAKPIWTANDQTINLMTLSSDNDFDSSRIENIQFGTEVLGIDYSIVFLDQNFYINNFTVTKCNFYGIRRSAIMLDINKSLEFNDIFINNNIFHTRTTYSPPDGLFVFVCRGKGHSRNTIIRNNIFKSNGCVAIIVGSFVSTASLFQAEIYNNIFEDNTKSIKNSGIYQGAGLGIGTDTIYYNYNSHFNNGTDQDDGNHPESDSYVGASNLITAESIVVENTFAFNYGYISTDTPDSILIGGTGTIRQMGLTVQYQLDNLMSENSFTSDTFNIVQTDNDAGLAWGKMMGQELSIAEQLSYFRSDNYETSAVNTALYNDFNSDSTIIASSLITDGTSIIDYPVNAVTYIDTNYFLINFKNIKGAFGWQVITDTDSNFGNADTDLIETLNQTTYYKQLENDVWYLKVRPYSR